MTPRLATAPRSGAGSRPRTARVGQVILVAVLLLAGLVLVGEAFHDPAFVPRIAVDNPSGYDVSVAVAASGARGELPLGTTRQRCLTPFHEVVDQGDTWIVHFRSQGVDAGTIAVPRDELERSGWTVRIPDEVVARLVTAGAPLSPVHGCPGGTS